MSHPASSVSIQGMAGRTEYCSVTGKKMMPEWTLFWFESTAVYTAGSTFIAIGKRAM